MLLNLKEYHRPTPRLTLQQSLDEALSVLARAGQRTVPLAGGDTLVASGDASVTAVVDLQALGLDYLRSDAAMESLVLGATVTRAKLATDEGVCSLASGVLSDGARRWSGNVQRNRATLGGAVAVASPDDPLVVALLACAATVRLYDATGYQDLDLERFLQDRENLLAAPALIVEISVPSALANQRGALALVARTPADAPVVAACAVIETDKGRCVHARLALGGVATTPVLISDAVESLAGSPLTSKAIAGVAARVAQSVNPPANYRGSAEYRRAMAEVLSARALLQAAGRAA